MRIVLVSDHAGVEAKAALAAHLKEKGHEVLDLGTDSTASVDYPDFAEKGGKAITSGKADRGVFFCGTGIGVCIAANKVRGIRAALVYDENSVDMSRKHNDANVVCLGARVFAAARIATLVDRWLEVPFEGGRHANRVSKITRIETTEGR